ncbi:MAG: hypothetical protein ABH817_00245 [archaeon]
MKLTVQSQEKKPLVEREEIKAIAEAKITPSNQVVKEELAKQLNKDKKLIVIEHIYQKFGSNESTILAFVYDSMESLEKFEPKIKKMNKEAKKDGKGTEGSKEGQEEKKE